VGSTDLSKLKETAKKQANKTTTRREAAITQLHLFIVVYGKVLKGVGVVLLEGSPPRDLRWQASEGGGVTRPITWIYLNVAYFILERKAYKWVKF
jgi:hypothetical protein